MKLRFEITQQRIDEELTWGAQVALQQLTRGEETDLDDAREMLVPFLVDENGLLIPETQARRIISRLKNKEIAEVMTDFGKALLAFMVPKMTATPSMSPSGTADAGPDGLQNS